MAIELWVAVDDSGERWIFNLQPEWDSGSQSFENSPNGYASRGFLADRLGRGLRPGEKARVVSIDLANDVVVLDKPESVEQKFEKLKSAIFRWTRGDINADGLVAVFKEVANKESQI